MKKRSPKFRTLLMMIIAAALFCTHSGAQTIPPYKKSKKGKKEEDCRLCKEEEKKRLAKKTTHKKLKTVHIPAPASPPPPTMVERFIDKDGRAITINVTLNNSAVGGAGTLVGHDSTFVIEDALSYEDSMARIPCKVLDFSGPREILDYGSKATISYEITGASAISLSGLRADLDQESFKGEFTTDPLYKPVYCKLHVTCYSGREFSKSLAIKVAQPMGTFNKDYDAEEPKRKCKSYSHPPRIQRIHCNLDCRQERRQERFGETRTWFGTLLCGGDNERRRSWGHYFCCAYVPIAAGGYLVYCAGYNANHDDGVKEVHTFGDAIQWVKTPTDGIK